ncbi:MAG: SpaH/EbpB family LPXTG-anchored major pilin [Solobacterium sp.]|nr:SpaH/EbpB family LPXTG-anchored major pilin [Solobacterium sp.]
MSVLKKLTTVMMALIMMLGLGVTAAAEGETTTGTITIKGSENGTVYNFYKIFALEGQDTSTTPDNVYDVVTYQFNDVWEGFFVGDAAPGKAYLVDTNSGNLNEIVVNGDKKYINITEGNVVAFTNAAMQYALQNNIGADKNATGTGSDLEVTGLALGYYLMIPVDASEKTTDSSGSVATLDSTMPNVEMKVKAKKPEIGKTDNKETVDVGETVTYTITGKVPNTSGYDTYKYVVKDEMTTGLTFKKDVVIKIGETDVTDKATIDYTTKANAFSADINVKELQNYVDQVITITYTAVVNDNAVIHEQEKNKAHLEYGHNPDDLESTTPIEEEVYTAKVIINKYTGNDPAATDKKLEGAKFVLMNSEGKFYKYTAAAGETPAKVEWVTVENAPAADATTITDAQAKALAASTAIMIKETNAQGAAEFPGIKDGTYKLIEVEAPEGYNRKDTPVPVTITGTDADTAEGKTENVADATNSFDAHVNGTADIENKAGTELPSTGGIGTTMFYVIGGALVIGAGVVLAARKKAE